MNLSELSSFAGFRFEHDVSAFGNPCKFVCYSTSNVSSRFTEILRYSHLRLHLPNPTFLNLWNPRPCSPEKCADFTTRFRPCELLSRPSQHLNVVLRCTSNLAPNSFPNRHLSFIKITGEITHRRTEDGTTQRRHLLMIPLISLRYLQ